MTAALEFLAAFASLNLTAMLTTAQVISPASISANVAAVAITVAMPLVATFISNEMSMNDDINRYKMYALGYVAAIVDRTPGQIRKLAVRYAAAASELGTHSNDFNCYVLVKAVKVGMLATKTRSFQRLLQRRRAKKSLVQ